MAYLLMTMIKIQPALKCELNYFGDMMADNGDSRITTILFMFSH